MKIQSKPLSNSFFVAGSGTAITTIVLASLGKIRPVASWVGKLTKVSLIATPLLLASGYFARPANTLEELVDEDSMDDSPMDERLRVNVN